MALRSALRILGIPIREVERRLGLSPSYLSRLLSGRVALKVDHVAEIARALGLDPAEVFLIAFSGGQVDITNGKFVFGCTEAYRIQDGKVGPALKNAMLIGSGPESLKHISMIGNDVECAAAAARSPTLMVAASPAAPPLILMTLAGT